jgi:predicted MPP superfamily phosphohydrolase
MFGRLCWRLWLLLTTLAVSASVTAAQPAAAPARIVAIGDLHGDFHAWRDIAQAARLIDGQGRWIGGSSVLVQTGDVVDRGPDSLKIIEDLMRLQREAKRAGGRVVALVGNHEAMNVTGDLRYVDPGEYAAFADHKSERRRENFYESNRAAIEAEYRTQNPKLTREEIKQAWMAATPLGSLEHQAAWHPKGKIGRWIVTNPGVLQLGDTLFVHGGLSMAYASMSIAEINQRIAMALRNLEIVPTSIINDERGPLWYRGLVSRQPEAQASSAEPAREQAAPAAPVPQPLSIDQELKAVLGFYGARRIVIGHTPLLSGIAIVQDGQLVRIDTGISRYYGGKLSYLEIIDGKLIPHLVARSASTPAEAQ